MLCRPEGERTLRTPKKGVETAAMASDTADRGECARDRGAEFTPPRAPATWREQPLLARPTEHGRRLGRGKEPRQRGSTRQRGSKAGNVRNLKPHRLGEQI